MTFRTRKKLVVWLLVIVSAWPMAHHVLVRTLGLNPWKWFGWSMYAVPPDRVRVFPRTLDDRPLGREALDRLTPDQRALVQAAYSEFITQNEGYGAHTRPDAFARALLEVHPQVEGVKLYIERIGMTRATGMYERQGFTEEPLVYRRDDVGLPPR